ncbi:MAG TPA: STAS domain-containing protein [Stenomitos sp.]
MHKVFIASGLLNNVNANALKNDVASYVAEGHKIVRVDFQGVTFINSSGIGALVATLKIVKAQGGEIFLYSLNPQVRMIFELTKMDQVFKISDDRAELEELLATSA